MKRLVYLSIAVVLAVASFMAGARWQGHDAAAGEARQKILYYACPMHPQYRSDRAGDCPSCGMRLEPVHAEGGGGPARAANGAPPPAGTVRVTPDRQQAIGVELGVAERLSGTHTIRTTGRVTPNENATYPIVAGVEGRVREVYSASAGSMVRKGQQLVSLYAPEFITAAQTFIAAVGIGDQPATAGRVTSQAPFVQANLQRAVDGLRLLGVSDEQIDKLQRTRRVDPSILVASPIDGFIVLRNALLGQRVEPGTELYRITDLHRIWILADIYENQQPLIRPGARARITTPRQTGRFAAVVSRAEPLFDESTRTLKVRLEADNPGFALKPGMFVDVEFEVEHPAVLAIPADAIVDSGLRKTVFVDRGNGYFEPRGVEIGARIGDHVEIVRGLMQGERIVVAGTFLVDSESRMKAAAAGIYGAATRDPVCGMEVDEKRAAAAGRTATHEGKTYYFCADECRQKFEKDPARYAAPGRPPPAAPGRTATAMPASSDAATAKDVVCGMDVEKSAARAAGRTSGFRGETYYFCSDDCKRKFDLNPGRYAEARDEGATPVPKEPAGASRSALHPPRGR